MSRRRSVLLTAATALVAGIALAALGVLDPLHAALLVVVVATVTAVWRTLDEGTDPAFPPVPEDRRDGARNDVSELGWATFTRDGAVGNRMRERLRALAAARLAERGVDLDDPGHHDAAARLLGSDVVDGLTSRQPAGRAEVHRWIDAIDLLVPTPPDATPPAHERRHA
ncbi:hypothetical protein LEP48_15555 [Isoptericola sp. NEAU-Y5]|uniref:Uncharacterized protein n=1 Tax=Isoptericola luteus TaxID=2879484 RepID=A0ABS7ZLT4_9MICO|nr:hypothetical protein [Isoptericola sp. NEAU-Y5]MCA5894755.1 hypothetical protein [Isoptericola sp. NEAU-Y5]